MNAWNSKLSMNHYDYESNSLSYLFREFRGQKRRETWTRQHLNTRFLLSFYNHCLVASKELILAKNNQRMIYLGIQSLRNNRGLLYTTNFSHSLPHKLLMVCPIFYIFSTVMLWGNSAINWLDFSSTLWFF